MKGIINVGGVNEIAPGANNICLLPVYDKPLIYYTLTMLVEAGIQDIVIVGDEGARDSIESFLGEGHMLGLKLAYISVADPGNDIEVLSACQRLFVDPVVYVSSPMLTIGQNHQLMLKNAIYRRFGATCFACAGGGDIVLNEFGNFESFSLQGKWRRTGLYVLCDLVDHLAQLPEASTIWNLLDSYHENSQLFVERYGYGSQCYTPQDADDFLDLSFSVAQNERFHCIKMGCVEEAAMEQGFLSARTLKQEVLPLMACSQYKSYLEELVQDCPSLEPIIGAN